MFGNFSRSDTFLPGKYYSIIDTICIWNHLQSCHLQKQPSRNVLKKRCTENTQQIYRRTPMPKRGFSKVACNFIEITLRHRCSPVNLLHICRTSFSKNTSGRLHSASYQLRKNRLKKILVT